MKPVLDNWKRVTLIVLACWGVAIGLHRLMPIELADYLPQSIIVQNGLLLPVAGTALLLTFIVIAAIFVLFQERLPGSKLGKGVWYGLLVSGAWLVAFVEPAAVLGTSLPTEAYNWLPDGLPLILMGVCLGLFAATDGASIIGKSIRQRVWPALIVAAGLLGGRYFAYSVLGINVPFYPQPGPVMAWTVALALWMGITYLILGQAAPSKPPFGRAVWFGGLVFGLDWLIGQLFFLAFYQLPVLNLVARATSDIVFVTLSVLIAEMVLDGVYSRAPLVTEQV